VRNLNTLADVRAASGEEERYSHSDLNGFAANPETARKVVDLLRPMLSKSAADLLPKIDKALADFDSELDSYKIKDGYASYDSISGAQRKQIADKARPWPTHWMASIPPSASPACKQKTNSR
jgi:iron uptake system EfeUOB component EfeO/EfeM